MNSANTDVTVIGLGAMGGTLASTLLDKSHTVTVWNRTTDKARPLAEKGAKVAESAAEAISSSPLTVMCVYDYVAANQILAADGVGPALSGRVLAQLTTGTCEQSDQQAEWVAANSGRFLDGGILAYPRVIGDPDTVIVYSGPLAVFEEHSELLSSLAGSQRLVGDGSAATVVTTALWDYYFGALGGFLEAVAYVKAADVSIQHFQELVSPMTDQVLGGIADGARRISEADYSGEQASVDVHVDGMLSVVDEIHKSGVRADIAEAFLTYCQESQAAGDAKSDVASVVKILTANAPR